MRTHISKSLQTRCKAIKNAVEAYNKAAASLVPPRPPVDWSAVSHYGFLEQFHLLQDTRNDIRGKRWVEPVVRNLMKTRHRIDRAKEEIERCHVEIRRLHTSIRDEQLHFQATLSRLAGTRIHGAVKEYTIYRGNVNQMLLQRIYQIYDLPGYSGPKTCGVRAGRGGDAVIADPERATPRPAPPAHPTENDSDDDSDDDDITEDEQLLGDISGMVQFVTHL